MVRSSFLAALLLIASLLAFGCEQKAAEQKPADNNKPAPAAPAADNADKAAPTPAPTAAAAAIKDVTVDEVATLVQGKAATSVDVNNATTRQDQGVIEGAVLLSGYKDFDPAAELPTAKDQKLVFYCGGQACSAAPKAAEKAAAAGYTQVHVMRAGIKGWKDAGKPTVSIPAAPAPAPQGG